MAAMNVSIGIGTFASFARGARMVNALATILQMPMAVTLF